MAAHQPLPSQPAPVTQRGIFRWLHENLFSTWFNSLVTLIVGYFLVTTLVPMIDWAFFSAVFVGAGADACNPDGACWVFIEQRFGFFIYGFYPQELRWRPTLAFVLFALAVVPPFLPSPPRLRRWIGIFGLTGLPIGAYILIAGGFFGLEPVRTSQWGGLMLTLILSYVGIIAALPIGVVLALGRRSEMPVIRGICVIFIEFWRSVPLITILFMASVMLPLFLPDGVSFDKLMRALVGIVFFQAAYMAEVVRGGLQAIPKGQYEAAEALGLGYWRRMRLIILPQALKIVIPGIANTVISLFKDTTLVLIIGLFDLLGAVKSTISDPAWDNVMAEGYLFVAFCFWVFCFGMSRYSHGIEKKLDTGHAK
ncbi:amino acid ABC transporter permease [Spiribacter vilamensis]|uniref:Amino acid ABC transporter membrane protein 2 (PAAT family) n=1 Tax=Spiribacter vilamensis TaxID=531306 RepID=A0A4Q8CZ04_9GAMM|nr:amino acid ABC transporter permease [Spiribacter vilamensis]RZU98238.1 amino acid ABC transporter membrane protein 2 (PAAT family) [Spiribacter vilamensis]TVO60863.1 amino acid ABC transporter permease [Spiribacter vilamensis]